MHRFFEPGFSLLHDLVLDALYNPTVHGILPLLRLNRYWRQLVTARLVRILDKKSDDSDMVQDPEDESSFLDMRLGKAFLKVRKGVPTEDEYMPFDIDNDPRALFEVNWNVVIETHGADLQDLLDPDTGSADEDKQPDLKLTMARYDPDTRSCTFLPVPPFRFIDHKYPPELDSDDDDNNSLYCEGIGPSHADPVFVVASTYWFRPALDGRNSHKGLQLAARPDLHPSIEPILRPTVGEKPGERHVDRAFKCSNGWIAHYSTHRLGKPHARSKYVRFVLYSVTVPLLDFFVPPTSAKADVYIDDETNEPVSFTDEHFALRGDSESLIELEDAKMQVAVGGLWA
ncbi:hypothetical protein JCM8208_002152 [Rhodotorula glutinis]